MSPHVQTFFDPATATATHLIVDLPTRTAAIVDPVLDFEPKAAVLSTGSADRILAVVEAQGLTLAWILETHVHADHLTAAHYLKAKTGAAVVIGARIGEVQATFARRFDADDVVADGRAFDRLVREGDDLPLGGLRIRVMETPGHTPTCVTYVVGDAAFVGDTLFVPDYGTARTDFPGGDAATLFRSIGRILALPDETRIFVGHDYLPAGRSEIVWETTVKAQRAHNIHVGAGATEAEFVAMREARDRTLAPPALILPSLQINIRAGALPPAAPSGKVFLRAPLQGTAALAADLA